MPDIDSAGARARQNPASVARAKSKKRVNTVPPQRASRVTIRPRRTSYRQPTSGRSSGRYGAVERRRDRRSTGRTSRSAPSSVPSSTAKVIKPPAPPRPPDVGTFLKGDSTYQRQLASFGKALADFRADQGLARTDYETNYQNTYRDIGLARDEALKNLENDYASRGLLQSSLYNTAEGEARQQYLNQFTDLGKQRTSFLDQLAQELGKFQNEQTTQSQNARAEALRRRSEKYNL